MLLCNIYHFRMHLCSIYNIGMLLCNTGGAAFQCLYCQDAAL